MLGRIGRRSPGGVRVVAILAGATLVAVALAGCTAGQERERAEKNSFSYSLQGASGGVEKEWSWETDGGTIAVSMRIQGASGTARLVLTDSAGKDVFDDSVSGAGQSSKSRTLSGQRGGEWTIRLTADGVAGQLDVSAKRQASGGIIPGYP